MHARRPRPEAGPIDRRRLLAAGLSAVLPGLGQAFNRRRQLTTLFLVPSLLLVAVVAVVWATQTPTRLAAWAVAPTVLGALLALNILLLLWRLLAVGQAFLDTRRNGPTGRAGVIGIAIIALLVVAPHLLINSYGSAFGNAFARVFQSDERGIDGAPAEGPGLDERLNVLVVGLDAAENRTTTLTDTMMVISLDPVAKTTSMVSLPRDLVGVPLGDDNVFGPKLNSLMAYADAHPDEFPDGGIAALEGAVGELLGIPIHYYARMDFTGFVAMVDAVGGVDITVAKGFEDPGYDGYGMNGVRGWSITEGRHHLDGPDALAYARSRKAAGESDFTRASRQQQILVALKNAATKDGSLFWRLPALLDAVGDAVTTDLPVDRLPQLAAIVDELGSGGISRAVIRHPLVRSEDTRYGSSLVPDLAAIRDVAAKLFPAPGGVPQPWPTPKATTTPASTAP